MSGGKDHALYDLKVSAVRTNKYGEKFVVEELYYTVYEARLTRTVPHLVFDSRQTNGKQFKQLFHPSQLLSFEGNFDRHFDTYSPMFYQVDTLSFITPELMQAMISESQYDYEIKGDRIFMYAPLLHEHELNSFLTSAKKILHEFNDNLKTYRDTRVKDDQDSISMFAQELMKNPNRYIKSMIISGLIIFVSLGFTYDSPLTIGDYLTSDLFFYPLAFLTVGISRYYKAVKSNEEKIQKFHAQQTILNHTEAT